MLSECIVHCKPKINWWKVPFEIVIIIAMKMTWGSEAARRMLKSETKYQNRLKGEE